MVMESKETKSEKALRRVIYTLFGLVFIAGIFFAMSVNGPGLPGHHDKYMISAEGQAMSLSCFFPLVDSCSKTTDGK